MSQLSAQWIYCSICIAKPHKRTEATSFYKLLKACERPLKSASKTFSKLAKAWRAYTRLAFTSLLQACDKPALSFFVQVNFRLYCNVFRKKNICFKNKFNFSWINEFVEAYLKTFCLFKVMIKNVDSNHQNTSLNHQVFGN